MLLFQAVSAHPSSGSAPSDTDWTPLFVGDLRDPLVAGHILAETAIGIGLGLLRRVISWESWQRGVFRLDSNEAD